MNYSRSFCKRPPQEFVKVDALRVSRVREWAQQATKITNNRRWLFIRALEKRLRDLEILINGIEAWDCSENAPTNGFLQTLYTCLLTFTSCLYTCKLGAPQKTRTSLYLGVNKYG